MGKTTLREFKVEAKNDNGKRWRIEVTAADGRVFEMQPVGRINIMEAAAICDEISHLWQRERELYADTNT
jgi:hypothetical protein